MVKNSLFQQYTDSANKMVEEEGPIYDKKETHPTVSRTPASCYFFLDSGDRFLTDLTPAVNNVANRAYNNFVIARNENLLQGQFKRIGISEIRFPFAIPNVNARNNVMWLNLNGAGFASITVPEGFYTGATLATALTTAIATAGVTVSFTADGKFSFAYAGVAPIFTLAISPTDPTLPIPQKNVSRSLLDLIGLYFIADGTIQVVDIKATPFLTNVADLKYTDYIDIVSKQLTNYQDSKDMSTQNLTPRSAVINRLYIENENSTNSPTNIWGTYPFVIHRQYTQPKMMKWEGQKSVGQVDISLYDMYGEPLYVPAGAEPPNFQITFLASED
jgi:hypothetical protein